MLKNKKYHTFFSSWLIGLIILMILIIVVGGLTRLTGSGLSITKWELFNGIFPPTNNDKWERYFFLYKEIPQYFLLNNKITLEEFKYIFLWEYFHRLLGRLIGLFFLLPFLFFCIKNILKKDLIINLICVFILIVIQGVVGWYMVKSGLVDNISVSHYRLAIHLTLAFIILSSLIWLLMNYIYLTRKKFFQLNLNYMPLKMLLFLIFTQIIIGAFVSGLDAGKIYQTWPLMNNTYFPSDVSLNDLFNFNSPSLVQFIHRNIAYIILFAANYLGFYIFKNRIKKLYYPYSIFFLIIIIQIGLGVSVLYSDVNLFFASMHQFSSILLVALTLNLYHHSIKS